MWIVGSLAKRDAPWPLAGRPGKPIDWRGRDLYFESDIYQVKAALDKRPISGPSRIGQGKTIMATYRLYYLRDNRLLGAEDIDAPTDELAARIARQRGVGRVVEVWDLEKRVCVVAPLELAHQ